MFFSVEHSPRGLSNLSLVEFFRSLLLRLQRLREFSDRFRDYLFTFATDARRLQNINKAKNQAGNLAEFSNIRRNNEIFRIRNHGSPFA